MALILGVALLLPGTAGAQAFGDRIGGYIAGGFSFSIRDLGLITVADAVTPVQFTNKFDAGPSGSAGLIVSLPTDKASLRVSVSYAQRSVTTLPALCDGFVADCASLEPGQGGVPYQPGETDATVLAVSSGVLLHAASRTQMVRPYFLIAMTLRGYSFDTESCSADALTCQAMTDFLGDQFRPNLSLGLGASIGAGPVEAMIEFVAHLGTFAASGTLSRGVTQNDFQLSAGLSFPLLSR